MDGVRPWRETKKEAETEAETETECVKERKVEDEEM